MLRVIKWMLLIFPAVVIADTKYCSPLGFCLQIPDGTVVINKANYQEHLKSLPRSLVTGFETNKKQEIIMEDKIDPAFILLRLTDLSGSINIDKTCKTLKSLDDGYLSYCGEIPWPSVSKQGLMVLTYNGSGSQSIIRIWLNVDKLTVYVVSVDKWYDESAQKRFAGRMLEILHTMYCK